jgi:hypothetical protein
MGQQIFHNPINQQIGDYIVSKRIGSGAFGQVYLVINQLGK